MNNDDKFTPTGVVGDFVKEYGDMNISTLTIREHFAVMAMQGLLASNLYDAHDDPLSWKKDTIESAVEYADALLKALEDV